MGVDHSILDPPCKRVLDILDRTLKVLFKLVLELGGDASANQQFAPRKPQQTHNFTESIELTRNKSDLLSTVQNMTEH